MTDEAFQKQTNKKNTLRKQIKLMNLFTIHTGSLFFCDCYHVYFIVSLKPHMYGWIAIYVNHIHISKITIIIPRQYFFIYWLHSSVYPIIILAFDDIKIVHV